MTRHASLVALSLAAATVMACSASSDGVDRGSIVEQAGKPESDGKPIGGKADEWNSLNNPERFRVSFDYALANLPQAGEAEVTPWPDTYWPTYKDSTNQRWQGSAEMSPLEKYDVAFNGWTPPASFMSLRPYDPSNCSAGAGGFDKAYYEALGPAAAYQSKNKGNAKSRNGIDDDGDGKADECDDNDGVESWWGLCHAWVPAAILEKEPQRAVTLNGVRFEVGDIKALAITMYDRSSSMMMGDRCNEKDVKRDDNGRVIDDECRDSNAGAFHVTLTNMLGRHKRSFAEDRTYDYEVWNQPFKSYRINAQNEVTKADAIKALGLEGDAYTYNTAAKRFVKVNTTVSYITEPSQTTTRPLVPEIDSYTGSDTYDYILEMDDAGNILGGEWIDYTQGRHPDFLWLPLAPRGGNPSVSMDKVRELIELSTRPESPAEPPANVRSFDLAPNNGIPDNDATGIESVIEITEDVSIGSLKVKVEVDHTYRGDLEVSLEREGLVVKLHDRAGSGADDLHETFEVGEFNGMSARGTWKLVVRDRAARDTGTLKSWSLLVSSTAPNVGNLREFVSTGLPLSIPDNDATGVTNVITVGEPGSIEKLTVAVHVTHPYVGDLTVSLTHGGVTKVLHAREGGSSNDIDKSFTVAGFSGAPMAGDWVLSVKDDAGEDVGNLVRWSLAATMR